MRLTTPEDDREKAGLPAVPWRTVETGFMTSSLSPCPYLPHLQERKLIAPWLTRSTQRFSDLSRAGFRRSHELIYRPVCGACHACQSVRVPVACFHPSKTQKRIAKRSRAWQLDICQAEATEEQYALFQRYVQARHDDGDMALMDEDDFRVMIEHTCAETSVFEWRCPETRCLLAACLVDHLDDGFSAVYSFFDPQLARLSPGAAMILHLIQTAQAVGLPYLYLGYWVKGSTKMAYKADYQPLERFYQGRWQSFEKHTYDREWAAYDR